MAQLNDWLSIDKTSGTGNAEITLSASSYEELVERSATIKVQGISTNAILTVKQNVQPYLVLDESYISLGSLSNVYTNGITSNVSWVAVVEKDWITLDTMSGGVGYTSFNISVTQTTVARSGKVFFKKGDDTLAVLTIKQEYDKNKDLFWIDFEESGGKVLMSNGSNVTRSDLWFSKDGESWTQIPKGEVTIEMGESCVLYIKNNTRYLSDNLANNLHTTIKFSQNAKVGGNMKALTDMYRTCCNSLFEGNEYLVDASELMLPWTDLSGECYYEMFKDCTSLRYAPSLKIDSAAQNSLYGMFSGCTSLIELDLTEVVFWGYGIKDRYSDTCDDILKGCSCNVIINKERTVPYLKTATNCNLVFDGGVAFTEPYCANNIMPWYGSYHKNEPKCTQIFVPYNGGDPKSISSDWFCPNYTTVFANYVVYVFWFLPNAASDARESVITAKHNNINYPFTVIQEGNVIGNNVIRYATYDNEYVYVPYDEIDLSNIHIIGEAPYEERTYKNENTYSSDKSRCVLFDTEITEIPSNLFANQSGWSVLSFVTIPTTVRKIGDYAFFCKDNTWDYKTKLNGFENVEEFGIASLSGLILHIPFENNFFSKARIIKDYAFNGTQLQGLKGSSIYYFKDIVLNNIETIGYAGLYNGTFSGLNNLTLGENLKTVTTPIAPDFMNLTCLALIAPSINGDEGIVASTYSKTRNFYYPQGSDYSTWLGFLPPNCTVQEITE